MGRVSTILCIAITFVCGTFYEVHSAPHNKNSLIKEGWNIFTQETFEGNGRTCATCHRPDNNFTIDPKFIATLPANDPLFVHEFVPELAELENAVLLRKFGLFLENVHGFNNPPVFRATPHNLALNTSIEHDDPDLMALNKTHALGWAGNGSAVGVFGEGPDAIVADGSLRSFAIGAIMQHLPKTLNRVPGEDFRFPSNHELDALEAFMLSLGRQKDINLAQMKFTDPFINKGRDLFFDERSGPCSMCHDNAGANTPDGAAMNFAIGVEDMPDAPHKLVHPDAAYDDGFGNERFNPPPLVEAADTAPFFHNHSVPTIEGAVAYFTSETFKIASGMENVDLEPTEVNSIAAMLRTINALENIRNSNLLDRDAMKENILDGRVIIAIALSDTEDAYQVLEGMEYNLFDNAVELLKEAHAIEEAAFLEADHHDRNSLLKNAVHKKHEASQLMVN